MTDKFLQDGEGNYSNSRLIADIIIVCALLMVFAFIAIGVWKPGVNLLAIATAIGVLFGSIAGSSLIFLYVQKKEEGSQAQDKTELLNK